MLTTWPSRLEAAAELRAEMGRLEDEIAVNGWPWDGERSHRLDVLRVMLEERRA
jgi:hypothetical protein